MLLLVTGASGAGKSTARMMVEPELPSTVECVELAQVLPAPPAPTIAWRQEATEAVVRRAVDLEASGRHLLLAGDPVAAAEVVAAPSATGLRRIAVCLLDLAPDAQAERLTARGDDPTLLHHHQAFAEWMRNHADDPVHMTHVLANGGWKEMRWDRLPGLAESWTTYVIDTTTLGRRGVADAVADWCRLALSGDAPAFRVGTGSAGSG